MLDCEFSSVGCNVRLTRIDLQGHLTAEQLLHLTMVNQKLVNENAILSRRISDLEVRVADQKREVEKMVVEKKELDTKMAEEIERAVVQYIGKTGQLKMVLFTLQVFSLSDFSSFLIDQECMLGSCDFYSGNGGYKMQIQLHCKLPVLFQFDIHMNLALLAVEFDEQLQWPFNGIVVIHFQPSNKRISIDYKNVPLDCKSKLAKGEKCGKNFSIKLTAWWRSRTFVTVEQVICDR